MQKKYIGLLLLFWLLACSHTPSVKTASPKELDKGQLPNLSIESLRVVVECHARGETAGAKVLKAALEMLAENKIVKGSCYDYVNAVFEKAGLGREKRKIIYRKPESGPYADPSLLRPGDWVMYRNLPYNEIGHSAIFVEWIDFYKRSALTIEYAGMNRNEPGRLREADLNKVYQLIRAKE